MRRRFAVALSAALGLGLFSYWVSGSNSGVQFVSAVELTHESTLFGGLSGLEVTQDSNALVAVGDRGTLFTAEVERDAEGLIEGVSWSDAVRLRTSQGTPLPPRARDAEGLVLADDGTIFVSFEGRHRVAHYALTGDLVGALPGSDAFEKLQGNSGLEAIATSPEGRLIAIPERSGAMSRPFPIYELDGDSWQQNGAIPRRGRFLPVGADFGPDGALYLLERDYFFSGFRSRVRRFDWRDGQLSDEKELLVTRFWQHDNLEGISVWQTAKGQIRLTLISDDNFNALQTSELVEYALTSP